MFIYGLCDPITKEIRYIGLTKGSIAKRLKRHIYDHKKKYHLYNWIRSLIKQDLLPIAIEIEKCNSLEELKQAEIDNIIYYKSLGARLCNITEGGESAFGYHHTENHKARMKELNKNRMLNSPDRFRFGKQVSKAVVCLNKDSIVKEFLSVSEAATWLGRDPRSSSAINACCKNKRNSAFGYTWKYKEV